jgi:hypothetical protein
MIIKNNKYQKEWHYATKPLRIDIFEISIKSRFLGRQKISGTLVDRSLKKRGKKATD